MCPTVDNPAGYKILVVIRFLQAWNMSAAEIRPELSALCGQNVISEETVRQRYRILRYVPTNVQDEEQGGRSTICNER
jgi:hypothetical protein